MYYWLLLKLFIGHFDFLKTSLSYLLLVILNIFTFLSKRTAFDSDYFLRVLRIIIGGYFRRIIHTNHLFIYRFQIILTFLRQIICKNNIINLALFLTLLYMLYLTMLYFTLLYLTLLYLTLLYLTLLYLTLLYLTLLYLTLLYLPLLYLTLLYLTLLYFTLLYLTFALFNLCFI